jgi:membrane peptidoglycan carboxypeptidase
MNIDQATAESVNCAFVRLSTSVGLDKVIDMAQKLGMRTNVAGRQPVNEWRVLTFTLGVVSITPLEMANITATIAGDGVHHDPIFVSKVAGPDGKVVFDETGRPGTRVLDPDVAHCAVSILHGPIDDPSGTASGKGIPGYDAFGKTGTNDQKVSSAFLGGTPNLVADVWHGLPDHDAPGAGFGADVPNGIWRGFMIPAVGGAADAPFPPPGPACSAPGKFIDPIAGRTTDVAPPAPPPPPAAAPPPAPAPNPGGGDRGPGPGPGGGGGGGDGGGGRGGGGGGHGGRGGG